MPAATPLPAGAPAEESDHGWLRWLAAAAVLLGLGSGAGYLFVRRRRSHETVDHEIFVPPEPEMPPAMPAAEEDRVSPTARTEPSAVPKHDPLPVPPQPGAAPAVTARTAPEFLVRSPSAQLVATLRPRRAGTNLTGAAVDYVITLANPSASAARDIRVDLGMLTASSQQDAQLRGFFAQPVERPVVAPFELPPGGQIELTGMATMPREALHVMEALGRPFFVPVVAMNVRYRADEHDRQATSAWIIGLDRGADAKMAPFRVDTPPRMHDKLASRVHEVA